MATPRPITAAIATTARESALFVYPALPVLLALAAVPDTVPVPVGLDVAVAGVKPLLVPEGVRVAVSMSAVAEQERANMSLAGHYTIPLFSRCDKEMSRLVRGEVG